MAIPYRVAPDGEPREEVSEAGRTTRAAGHLPWAGHVGIGSSHQ